MLDTVNCVSLCATCIHFLPKSKMGVSKGNFLTAVFQSKGLPSAATPPSGNRTWFPLNPHSTEEPLVTAGGSAVSAVQMVVFRPHSGFLEQP